MLPPMVMSLWNVIYRACWMILCIMLVGAAVHIFVPKLHEYRANQRLKAVLLDDQRQKEEMIKILKTKQQRFVEDREFVEQLAHDLGLARPGEVLFKFVDEP